MTRLALDTSVAVPLLLRNHAEHQRVRAAVRQHEVLLTAHSLVETYSVLTRLSGDARLGATDAARALSANFATPATIDASRTADLPNILAENGIVGGAVYDALVGLATFDSDATLLTRDKRAAATYRALHVDYVLI